MRSVKVVIRPPRLDFAPRVRDRQELMRVQTFIAQLAIEGLENPFSPRSPRAKEVEQYAPPVGPFIERSACEFSAVVHGDRSRFAMTLDRPIQRLRDRLS